MIEPWGDEAVRRALLEVLLLGIAGGALGVWVVLHRLGFAAESLAHGLLPGLVVAALAGLPLVLGGAAGLAVGAAAVALAQRAGARDLVGRDGAIAVAVTPLLGLGVLLALSPDTPAHLTDLLFGDVLATSGADLALATGLAAAVLAALGVLHPRLVAVGLDPAGARALGVRPAAVDLALLGLLALVLTVAVRGLGNLLVVALLVAPAATAGLWTRRLGPLLAGSVAVAVLAGWGGLYLSFYADTAAGASIAALLVAAWAVSLGLSRGSGRTGRAGRPRGRRPRSRPARPPGG